MTDDRRTPARRSVGLVTTAVVSMGSAAAVGWAAAMPPGAAHATAPQTDSSASSRAAQQLVAARAHLEQVRRDIALMVSREDNLPRAELANVSSLMTRLPTVRVPQASAQPPVAQAPATHTTTGASGVHP